MPSRAALLLICVGEYIIEFVTKCLVYRRQILRIDPEYLQSRRERKKVETLFAHLKRILRLNRLRLRGPSGAKDAFLLAAIAQNLPKLAKLVEPQFGPSSAVLSDAVAGDRRNAGVAPAPLAMWC
jgi:hypothetical protein